MIAIVLIASNFIDWLSIWASTANALNYKALYDPTIGHSYIISTLCVTVQANWNAQADNWRETRTIEEPRNGQVHNINTYIVGAP